MEEWKQIEGCEHYEVSNMGNIKNTLSGEILKTPLNTWGYPSVTLCGPWGRKNKAVHRLVAEAFIPNIENLPEVNHKDGNKRNNTVENLEWCTAKENVRHSVDACLRTSLKAVDMYSLDGEYIRTFQTIAMAAKETGIVPGHISGCCKGRYGYKTAGGYVWKYHEGSVQNV